MSLRSVLISSLLAATAIAGDYGSGSGSWGGSGGNEWAATTPAAAATTPAAAATTTTTSAGWSSWESAPSQAAPAWGAAPSCPAGCTPMGSGGSPPAAPGQMIVQVVSVSDANGSLKYFPDNIQAPIGSIVQFQFHPKNHTITESSFAEPCKPIAANLTSATRPGVKSGFIPVTGNEPFTPVYNVLVNDTKPIWIYCGQTGHCQKGMAMVINQNSSSPNTIEKYIANAAQLPVPSAPAPAPGGAAPSYGGAAPSYGGSAPAAPATTPATGTAPVPQNAGVPGPSSVTPPAPATFTGGAIQGISVPQASTTFAGMILTALLALW